MIAPITHLMETLGDMTAMEVLGSTVVKCYEDLESIGRWEWWRKMYPETSEQLFEYVVVHDSLELMPADLQDCYRNMATEDRENLVRYVSLRNDPLTYRGMLNSCSSIDKHNSGRKPHIVALIVALREERDNGRYQKTWDYARSDDTSVPIGVKECFQKLFYATYRVNRGTFHPFSLDKGWLKRNKPWAEECLKQLTDSGEI